MSTITKEWLRSQISAIKTVGITDSNTLQAFEIALASLEAEAVYFVEIEDGQDINAGRIEGGNRPDLSLLPDGINHLYAAPPASVENTGLQRKAAIHDALCEKYNVESLIDFVEWQRNHIAELKAAPPAPVGHGEAAVMPDYPGYVMTQRECFEAGKKARLAELVTTAYKLPFEQWLSQQTGTIDVECGCVMTEVFFHWLRVAYEAGNSPQCREISNSSTNNFRENAETSTKCWCRTCRPVTFADSHFVVCPECGNKRCPHANDHRHACTGSNEPGQEGSAYPAAPQQEVK
ncbi:hypothetical protein RKK57_000200 [Enterobacter hormaechei]